MTPRVARPATMGREDGPGRRRPRHADSPLRNADRPSPLRDADGLLRTGRPALLLAAAVLSGCGGDAVEAARATLRDGAGIEIVDNPTEPPERWSLGPEPVVDVGIVEGDEAYQLSDVTGAVWSSGESVQLVSLERPGLARQGPACGPPGPVPRVRSGEPAKETRE